MFRVTHAALALIAALAPAAASAGTLTYSGFQTIDGENVTLTDSVFRGGQVTAYAGLIQLDNVNGGAATIESFCVDIADELTHSGSFTTGTSLSSSLNTEINALISNATPQFGNPQVAAAVQVAIWEAEYPRQLSVTGNDAVTALAGQFLADVSNGTWKADPTQRVMFLNGNGTTQSQAYLASVPEPATLALIGAGLIATACVGRGRRSVEHVE